MITVKKMSEIDALVELKLSVPLSKMELAAYELKGSVVNVMIRKFEKEFDKFKKDFKKNGELVLSDEFRFTKFK
jgi:hypothetical protein